jgi:GT2 family glycosyltransferase
MVMFIRTRYRIWLISFMFRKWLVKLSEKLGLLSYRRWFRRHHKPPQCEPISSGFGVGLLIWADGCHPSLLKRTLKSLKNQSGAVKSQVVVATSESGDFNFCSPLVLGADVSLTEILKDLAGDPLVDYVGMIRAGDTFESFWLKQCACALQHADPLPTVIYTDQDQIAVRSQHHDQPFLKPDFSSAMQLSVNLLGNALFQSQFVLDATITSEGFEDLVDELAFRSVESKGAITHVVGVLSHTVKSPFPDRNENQRRLPLVKAHLSRLGFEKPDAELESGGQLRVSWAFKKEKVSIIILNKDRPDMLRQVLTTLVSKTTYPVYEVILVDNASSDPDTLAIYAQYETEPWFKKVQAPKKFNYSAFNNLGVRHADGTYLLFLNNDIEIIEPNWLAHMVQWASRPDIGMVGAQLLYPDGRLQHAGVVLGLVGSAGHVFCGERPDVLTPFGSPQYYRDTMAETAACLMTHRAVFEALGGFDETYALAFSDVTFCLAALEQGYRNVYNPFVRLIHHEGGTRGKFMPYPDLQRMYWDLRPWVEKGDPFYNPLLSNLINKPSLRRFYEESSERIMDYIQSRIALG